MNGNRESFDDRRPESVRRPRAVPEYATRARHLRNQFERWFALDQRVEPADWKAG